MKAHEENELIQKFEQLLSGEPNLIEREVLELLETVVEEEH